MVFSLRKLFLRKHGLPLFLALLPNLIFFPIKMEFYAVKPEGEADQSEAREMGNMTQAHFHQPL